MTPLLEELPFASAKLLTECMGQQKWKAGNFQKQRLLNAATNKERCHAEHLRILPTKAGANSSSEGPPIKVTTLPLHVILALNRGPLGPPDCRDIVLTLPFRLEPAPMPNMLFYKTTRCPNALLNHPII